MSGPHGSTIGRLSFQLRARILERVEDLVGLPHVVKQAERKAFVLAGGGVEALAYAAAFTAFFFHGARF